MEEMKCPEPKVTDRNETPPNLGCKETPWLLAAKKRPERANCT